MPEWAAAFFVVVGCVIVTMIIVSIAKSSLDGKVRRKGTSAPAWVKKVETAGRKARPGKVWVYFDLDIARPDGSRFAADLKAEVSVLEPPKVGADLPVKYLESTAGLPRIVLAAADRRAVEDEAPRG
jgi:hypothetical protein